MELDIYTVRPRIRVIEIDNIFGKCFNLLGRVAVVETLKIDWWGTCSKES